MKQNAKSTLSLLVYKIQNPKYQSPKSQSTTLTAPFADYITTTHRKIAITPARTPSITEFAFNSGAAFLVGLGVEVDEAAAGRMTADVDGVEVMMTATEVLKGLGVV
jgi:hypothetical protein